MSTRKRRSRIQFQPPFLVGALGALTFGGGGCGALVSDAGDESGNGSGGDSALDGSGGPDGAGCPDVLPANGAPCSPDQAGLTCGSLAPCSAERELSCGADGLWTEHWISCNPPPIETICPAQVPAVGTSCAGYQEGLVCGAFQCTGAIPVSCGADDVWHSIPSSCNPPGMGGAPGFGGSDAADGSAP